MNLIVPCLLDEDLLGAVFCDMMNGVYLGG